METYIKASSDLFIKYLLGTEKNKELLLYFINAVLEDSSFQKIISVEIKNPFNIKTFSADKETVLDVKATDEKGREYDIEVQSSGTHLFKNRSLYYWSKLYSNQLKESEIFKTLKPVICINVLDFILFKELEKYHNCFMVNEINNSEFCLTDHLMIHYIELPKLNRFPKTALEKWSYFLRNEGKEDKEMTILIKEDKIIQRAHEEYNHFSHDDKMRELYEDRLKFRRNYLSDLEEARDEAREEGKIEDAKRMHQFGADLDFISKVTELPLERLKAILKIQQ